MLDKFRRVCYFCHAAMEERAMTATDGEGDYCVPTFHCPNGHGQVYVVAKQKADTEAVNV